MKRVSMFFLSSVGLILIFTCFSFAEIVEFKPITGNVMEYTFSSLPYWLIFCFNYAEKIKDFDEKYFFAVENNSEIYAFYKKQYPEPFGNFIGGNPFKASAAKEHIKNELIKMVTNAEKDFNCIFTIGAAAEFFSNHYDFEKQEFLVSHVPIGISNGYNTYYFNFRIPNVKVKKEDAEKLIGDKPVVYLPVVFDFKMTPRSKSEKDKECTIERKRITVLSMTIYKDAERKNILFSQQFK